MPDIRVLADAFLETHKTLAGIGSWEQEHGDHGSCRLVRPVQISGELPGHELVVKAYPRDKHLKFRIVLTMQRAIWRVDFAHDETHPNPPGSPPELPSIIINEPHYHSWADNRCLATQNVLPRDLNFARILSRRIKRFEQAFRWFCDQTNIRISLADIPELPKADTLL